MQRVILENKNELLINYIGGLNNKIREIFNISFETVNTLSKQDANKDSVIFAVYEKYTNEVDGYFFEYRDEYKIIKNSKPNNKVYQSFLCNFFNRYLLNEDIDPSKLIPKQDQTGEITVMCNPQLKNISITWYTRPIMLTIDFRERGVEVAFVFNNHEANYAYILLDMDNNENQIYAAKLGSNNNNEEILQNLDKEQLSALIQLSITASSEEVDFSMDSFLDDILKSEFKHLHSYTLTKEMEVY